MFIVMKKNMIVSVAMVLCVILTIGIFLKDKSQNTNENISNTVVIDAGHGGMDGGCIGIDGVLEKDINLSVAKKVKDVFEKNGYKVIMTREEDNDLSDKDKKTIKSQKNSDLKNRTKLVNNSDCTLFISIHMNQYTSPEIFGSQVFYNKNDEESEKYAKSVMECLKEIDGKNKRVAKFIPNKNLVFSNIKVPGILVECGFLSNPEECKKLQDETYQKKIADAVYRGIVKCRTEWWKLFFA